jgi:hypothetical protein
LACAPFEQRKHHDGLGYHLGLADHQVCRCALLADGNQRVVQGFDSERRGWLRREGDTVKDAVGWDALGLDYDFEWLTNRGYLHDFAKGIGPDGADGAGNGAGSGQEFPDVEGLDAMCALAGRKASLIKA